ncbi:MAG TPA: hypothetical protein VIY69_15395 [Candidatus Acidoferrales bacterium]
MKAAHLAALVLMPILVLARQPAQRAPVDIGLAPQEFAQDEALIAAFARSYDADDLKKAVDAVASQPRMAAPARHQYGHDDVALWLRLFASIEAAEEALPQSKDFRVAILCDVGGGGPPMGPCGPPVSEIKDPAVKTQYEAAIAANERARLATNNFGKIRNLKEQVDALFWVWAGGMYRGNSDAQAQIGQDAQALGCSQMLAAWIEAVTALPKGAFPPDDPASREEFIADVPVALTVSRSGENLVVSLDASRKQELLLVAGRGRMKGVRSELRVYPEGTERPAEPNGGWALSSSVDTIFTQNHETKVSVRPGVIDVVEEDFTIFETDVPTQHMWAPQDSPNYKVLWQGALKQIVNP